MRVLVSSGDRDLLTKWCVHPWQLPGFSRKQNSLLKPYNAGWPIPTYKKNLTVGRYISRDKTLATCLLNIGVQLVPGRHVLRGAVQLEFDDLVQAGGPVVQPLVEEALQLVVEARHRLVPHVAIVLHEGRALLVRHVLRRQQWHARSWLWRPWTGDAEADNASVNNSHDGYTNKAEYVFKSTETTMLISHYITAPLWKWGGLDKLCRRWDNRWTGK